MRSSVPVYIEERAGEVHAQALFDDQLSVLAPSTERALQLLQARLLGHLQALAGATDQRQLASWLASPPFRHDVLTPRVRHAGQQHVGQVLIVCYEALGRSLAFTPRWPHRHFEVLNEETLVEQVGQVFTAWLGEEDAPPSVEDLLVDRLRVRIHILELDWQPLTKGKAGDRRDGARMGGESGEFDGGTELAKVATRVLPTQTAIARDSEVAALAARLYGSERRAVLLLGPSGVGKTCLLHACLATQKEAALPLRVWHIAPPRVISGMAYLGQWEARWLAILQHAASSQAVLYFDDLLGLFSAGQSSGSALSMGDLLPPWLSQGRVRVLGEITPEAWRVLRERYRSFADQFFVLPIAAPPPEQRWRIVANLLRDLESRERVRFTLDAVPTALALADRYFGHRAFPGRIAEVLQTLATRAPGQSLDRAEVIAEFVRRTGHAASLVDLDQALTRADIETALGRQLKGQPQAITVLADVLLRAKAGLNDPGRPLATLLLLGPTGVGKTACAKALASFLGGSEALIRIDLNEYAEFGDAARLVGTFAAPDGVLTAAIRRQPCAVVLLDEIEKAAPDVFDLLLSLLDEARLTDAHGRVAHFQQAVIVMTSNLGAREAGRRFGFTAAEAGAAGYAEAARRFFRPEFYNRIDAILPFAPLGDAELRAIAEQRLSALLARSGLRTRQCLIDIDSAAIDALTALGRDVELGARALKRGIEKALVQPLARVLAATRFDTPTRIHLSVVAGQLSLQTTPLPFATPRADASGDPGAELARMVERLQDIEAELDAHRGRGELRLDHFDEAQAHYAVCREQQRVVQQLLERAHTPPGRGTARRLPRMRDHLHHYSRSIGTLAILQARVDLQRQESAWVDAESPPPPTPWSALQREYRWLEALLVAPQRSEVQLRIRALDALDADAAAALAQALAAACSGLVGCLDARADAEGLRCSGFAMDVLWAQECGYWLRRDHGLALIEVNGPRSASEIIRLSRGARHLDLRHGTQIDDLNDAVALRALLLQGLSP